MLTPFRHSPGFACRSLISDTVSRLCSDCNGYTWQHAVCLYEVFDGVFDDKMPDAIGKDQGLYWSTDQQTYIDSI